MGSNILMASNQFPLNSNPISKTQTLNLPTCSNFISCPSPSKPTSNFGIFSLKTSAISTSSNGSIPTSVKVEKAEVRIQSPTKLIILNEKLMKLGIDSGHCNPGQYYSLSCPMCKGGEAGEQTLSLFIAKDGDSAFWTCFRGKCGWKGSTQTSTDAKSSNGRINKITKTKEIRKITEQGLGLQPLCNEIRAYFAERMISGETLQRNFVMQKPYGDQIAIAFTYRRNGQLVSCKYRDINKKFWQESNTEKIFYGVDDIKGASDIIIVEGEMDKLAMEEAGFRNCVSVPDGAPPSVSKNSVPSKEEVFVYQELCKYCFVIKLVSAVSNPEMKRLCCPISAANFNFGVTKTSVMICLWNKTGAQR